MHIAFWYQQCLSKRETDRHDSRTPLHFLRNTSQEKALTKNVECFTAHTFLNDCYRGVGTGRACETGQGDRAGSTESPVLSCTLPCDNWQSNVTQTTEQILGQEGCINGIGDTGPTKRGCRLVQQPPPQSLLSFQQTRNACAVPWHSWCASLKEQLMDLHVI